MDTQSHFGLPKLVVDLLTQQSADSGLDMKWKIFNSGKYTELKLIWCPKSVDHKAKYSTHKPPSSLRRDRERKQAYMAKMRNNVNARSSVSVSHVSTQCDIPVPQTRMKTRSQSKQTVLAEMPRSFDLSSEQTFQYTDSPISAINEYDSITESPVSTMSHLVDQVTPPGAEGLPNFDNMSPDVLLHSNEKTPPGVQFKDLSLVDEELITQPVVTNDDHTNYPHCDDTQVVTKCTNQLSHEEIRMIKQTLEEMNAEYVCYFKSVDNDKEDFT